MKPPELSPKVLAGWDAVLVLLFFALFVLVAVVQSVLMLAVAIAAGSVLIAAFVAIRIFKANAKYQAELAEWIDNRVRDHLLRLSRSVRREGTIDADTRGVDR